MSEPAPLGLPAGYGLRRPRGDDLDEVVALVAAADLAATGETTASRDDLAADWALPRFDLGRHAWLVVTGEGRVAAYAWVLDAADQSAVDGQFLVHPEHQWRGLEAPLLEWAERFAASLAAAADARSAVDASTADASTAARAAAGRSLGVWCGRGDRRAELYLESGFTRTRTFLRLRLTLDRLPDDPLAYAPPPGLEVRRFVARRDERAAWATLEESFADHFRESPMPFEEWRALALEGADTDLWFTAWDGDEMAGCITCYAEAYGGHVDRLGVRRRWRGRGLGRLLLLTAFAALRDHGCAEAVLGVDADNASGALALYESLGMRRTVIHDFYEKPLPR